MTRATDVDVLVVGCGPVGAVLAALLGAAGVRVLVVERDAEPFPLPRAVAADDEVLRILTALPGCADLLDEMTLGRRVHLTGRDDRPLVTLEFDETPLGQPGLAFFTQPALEARLREVLDGLPSVTVACGWALRDWTQDAHGVTARVAAAGGERRVRAGYLVGCDGAGSSVRTGLGIGYGGSTFAQPWLVVDVAGVRPERLAEFTFRCRPQRPAVSVPTPGGHRFEWMLLPGETPAQLLEPAVVDGLLRAEVGDLPLPLVRAAVYTFHARVATRWRAGRVFLAGDAAHAMPPFAGQGLGAGVRDADNLAWKLAAVLAGEAGDALLDSYERERRAHVREMVALSRLMGALVSTRDPRAAAARDLVLAGLARAPGVGPWLRAAGPKPLPGLPRRTVPALVPRRSARGGRLLPSPRVRLPDGTLTRLAPVLGRHWAVLGLGPDPAALLDEGTAAFWRARSARLVRIGAAGVVDLDGTVEALRSDGELVLVRPDGHVLATLHRSEVTAATRAYAGRIGVTAPASPRRRR